MHMCLYQSVFTCVHLPLEAIGGCWIPRNWIQQVVVSYPVLGTKPGSSGREISTLTADPSLQPFAVAFMGTGSQYWQS